MGKRRQLAGSRVLVTGASQGIGRAIAKAATQRGMKVLAVARSESLLAQLAADNPAIVALTADVTVVEDRRRMVETAQQAFGGIDILINNAGIGATGHFVEASPERLRQIMEVNFFAAAEMIRAFLPLLREGTNPAIVNISSIAGKRAIPARSEYSASKFAMEGFSQALRAELVKWNIDVLLVAPGLTQTNFSKNMIEQKALMAVDHMRGMTADAVAEAVLKAMERGSNNTVLTLPGKLLTFVSRFFPRLADRIAARKVRSLFRKEMESRNGRKA